LLGKIVPQDQVQEEVDVNLQNFEEVLVDHSAGSYFLSSSQTDCYCYWCL